MKIEQHGFYRLKSGTTVYVLHGPHENWVGKVTVDCLMLPESADDYIVIGYRPIADFDQAEELHLQSLKDMMNN